MKIHSINNKNKSCISYGLCFTFTMFNQSLKLSPSIPHIGAFFLAELFRTIYPDPVHM